MAAVYDPKEFGRWLQDAFDESPYKSWQQVAEKVDTSRSTLSRYAGAKKQTLTDKPSKPSPDLVIRLAELFGKDVNEALMKGGHSPLNATTETIDINGTVKVRLIDASKYTEEDKQDLANDIRIAVEIFKRRVEERQAR